MVLVFATTGPKDGSKEPTVLNYFARIEFQDGKRKRYTGQFQAAQQFYHGRGTPHVHVVVWLAKATIPSIKLENIIRATSPNDNAELKCLIEGSQRSYTGSGWPKYDGESHWDSESHILRLHHNASDKEMKSDRGTPEGVRAYIVDTLTSLYCHHDVQMSDGRGMLLRYVSGYVPKFSDSFATEWLNDQASANGIARRVLCDYHPVAPEIVLQLAMQWFPQVFKGGTMPRFRVPVPFETEPPERVKQYMACKWRREDMTLAEYLRKTNNKGNIQAYLKKRHHEHLMDSAFKHYCLTHPNSDRAKFKHNVMKEYRNTDSTLEEFLTSQDANCDDKDRSYPTLEMYANSAQTYGEVMVAAMYLSRYNDRYYGQWILMNTSFRCLRQLSHSDLQLVPDHLYYQAMALKLRPDVW